MDLLIIRNPFERIFLQLFAPKVMIHSNGNFSIYVAELRFRRLWWTAFIGN